MKGMEQVGRMVESKTRELAGNGSGLLDRGLKDMQRLEADPQLRRLIEALRRARSWNERIDAWQQIRRLGPDTPGYEDCLLQALYDSDGWARILAAEALAWYGLRPRDAIPVLAATVDASLRHRCTDWARVACGAMGKYRRPAPRLASEALPALITALDADDADVRAYAALALGQWGPASRPALVRLALEARQCHPALQEHFVSALSEIDPEVHDPQTAILKALEDPEPAMRRQALEALDPQDSNDETVERLLPLFGDDDPGVRQRLALMIGQLRIDRQEAIVRLEHLGRDRDEAVRLAASYALVRLGIHVPRQLKVLRHGLHHRHRDERRLSAWALGEVGKEQGWRNRRALKIALQTEKSEPVQRMLQESLRRLAG